MTFKLQQDFLLLFQCIIDFGADVLRDFTKGKMKTNYLTDNFKIFLGKTKHHLFHQIPKQSLICCACPITGCSIRKTGKIDRRIFDKFYFYDKTLPIPHGHQAPNGNKNTQTCICRFVEINKVLDDLDLSDLNCLLRNLPIMTSLEENLLKELMEVRGKVCHAVTTKTFSQPELTNLWTKFMNSVCKLCPSDPKYLKKAIDLTKSTVLTDDNILELIEKVQQVITDCHEIKPVFMEYTEKFNVFENRQNEHNTKVETRLARLESLFMGHFEAKQNNTEATISVYDSEKSNITDVTYSGKQGDRYIECEANCPGLDEDKALKRLATETDVNCSKKLKIESVEKHCILLKLSTRPELFESEEILHSAIMSLVQKISDAGDLDTSVDRKMDIKITFTSPLTDDERHTIVSMLGTYGSINEGYITETTNRDEGIGDIDSNMMDYPDINTHDDKKMLFPKEEYMTKLQNPFYTIKKEDMRNMPMDLADNVLKKESNETKSLNFQNGTVKMEATERQDDEIFLRIGSLMCLWRIKGLPKRLQHLDANQDMTVNEGNQVWYLQWRLECPKEWDVSSVVEKLNINKRLIRGFFNIDFVHSEVQREIVIETNTEKHVFNSYSSAELAFKTFIGTIVKVCELETTEPFDMSVTTSVLAVTERSDDNEGKLKMTKVIHNCQKRKRSAESPKTFMKTEPIEQELDQSCQYPTRTSGLCSRSPSQDDMIYIPSLVVTPTTDIHALVIDKQICRVLSNLEAELCQHITNIYAATMGNYHCENLKSGLPDLNDLVNTSDQTVRRLVSFAQLIEDFKELDIVDKICALKSCVLPSLMLRSVYFFDVEQEGWRTLTGIVPAKILKDIKGYSDMYATHTNFCREMKKTCEEDITLFAIIQSIVLFNPERVGFRNLQLVSDIQNRYIMLLKSYLEYKISFEHAQIYFPFFLRKIQELRTVGSDHAKIIPQVQTSKIEPLMREFFNLN